ncbi:hypothetical protein LBMAG46_07570 [Planctomycetia bacterium]|nr:hypothetical protein LBMAG46_07570 [Planctomycetia bacterium]
MVRRIVASGLEISSRSVFRKSAFGRDERDLHCGCGRGQEYRAAGAAIESVVCAGTVRAW